MVQESSWIEKKGGEPLLHEFKLEVPELFESNFHYPQLLR